MDLKGGYYIINKTDNDIYARLQKALSQGKPILFYEDENTCYYIDSISGGEITTEIVDDEEITTYGDIVLTKGGKTITITYENVVTELGDVNNPLIELIKDASGNYRFVEGDGVALELTGFTPIYNKWSLSGSHLMFVLCAEIADTTILTSGVTLSTFTLPKWIYDKIQPVWLNFMELKYVTAYADNWSSQSCPIALQKGSDNTIRMIKSNELTLTADRKLRVQFDLLIDDETE